MKLEIKQTPPSAQDFIDFRKSAEWGEITQTQALKAIENSLYWVSLYGDGKCIGFGRIIGDGVLNFYIQDVIIDKAFRGLGGGEMIMQALMAWLKINAKLATIGLLSVAGKEDFYKRFGFTLRPQGKFGAGMMCIISEDET